MPIIQPEEIRDMLEEPVFLYSAFLKAHDVYKNDLPRLEMLDQYYIGQHPIMQRTMRKGLPNNKLVANYAKYITDMASGYLVGKPVLYSSEDNADLDKVLNQYRANDVDSLDMDIAKDCSVYGRAYELDYQDENTHTRIAVIDPRNCFLVVGDTVERKPMYGAHILEKKDVFHGGDMTYVVTLYTADKIFTYKGKTLEAAVLDGEPEEHFFGHVPLIEYQNNEELQGDFEQVISLIDAYEKLISDRINAKEQDIDAILATYGVETMDEEEIALLKKERILGLPGDAKAEWLIKQLSESDNETVREALNEDIHKFSLTPDLTDRNFAGNSSGVAMQYKVMGFDQLTEIKERYFKAGLKSRLVNFMAILNIKGAAETDPGDVTVKFTRNLPVNLVESAQVAATLNSIVSRYTIYELLPFIENPSDEEDRFLEERQQNIEAQRSTFGYPDVNDEDGTNVEEEADDEE